MSDKTHSLPLCCPQQYGAQPVSRALPTTDGSDSDSNDSAQPLNTSHKKCVDKPLSEWTKLDGKRTLKKGIWMPLKDKKTGKVCACNPQQLENLEKLAEQIEARARANGPALSWSEFNGGDLNTYTEAEQLEAQTQNKDRMVLLTQADFAAGTVRLRQGGYFRLEEDVVFDPNANVGDWFERRAPSAAQRASGALYSGDAYIRGFFAAVAISGSEIYLDLNGHEIKFSALMNARQRFASIIELADQPFPVAQGPGNFGDEVLTARKTIVANGTLGQSPHHGIHGNEGKSNLLQNIEFKDYEVAAISLNGVVDQAIDKCTMHGTSQNVLFNSKLSAAVFGIQDARNLLQVSQDAGTGATQEHTDLVNALSNLSTIVQPMLENGTWDSPDSPFALPLCNLPGDVTARVIDGNAYGILINSRGIAVNAFDEEAGDSSGQRPDSEQISITNTTIRNTFNNVQEIPALFDTRDGQTGPVVDTTGAVLDLSLYFDCAEQRYDLGPGAPPGNASELVLLQIAVVQLRERIANDSPQTDLSLFAVGRVPSELFPLLTAPNQLPCSDVPSELVWKRNGDSMFHVNKGTFGIRADGITGLCVRETVIDGVANCGSKGIFCALPCEDIIGDNEGTCTLIPIDLPENCCALDTSGNFNDEFVKLARSPYTNSENGGHPGQSAALGYCGADSYGFTISGVTSFDLSKIEIKNVLSDAGTAVGLVSQFQSHDGEVSCVAVENVRAADKACAVDFTQGAKTPVAQGVRVDTSSTNVAFKQTSISGVSAVGFAACRWCINSSGVSVNA